MRICREAAWEVDAALRPEGKAGRAGAHRSPGTWPTTSGGPAPGSSRRCSRRARWPATPSSARPTSRRSAPLVWTAGDRPGLRRRRAGHAPARRGATSARDQADRELKLGRGGLRDVEFAVQLLQLVHGRADAALRVGGTLPALRALSAGGYVGPRRRRATSPRPTASCAPSSTGCSCSGCAAPTCCPPTTTATPALAGPRRWATSPTPAATPSTCCRRSWRRNAREVRRLHEKLFYRPLLAAVARRARRAAAADGRRRPPTGCGRSASPTRRRALRHLAALTGGVSPAGGDPADAAAGAARRARPRPDPDAGLLAYRQVSRGARRHPVVPAAAARRGPGRGAAGAAARDLQPLRRRPARARAGGAAAARRRRRAR